MTQRPWFQFYAPDWRADPELRVCSLAARGLWMEMLCLMHEAEPRGTLKVNGKTLNTRQLASLAGIGVNEAEELLTELEEAGVFSRDEEGTIFSRRMCRDTEKSKVMKARGSKGGNPQLNQKDKPEDNHKDVSLDKPHMVSGFGLTETPTSEKQASTREGDLDRIEGELREAAGLANDPSPSLFDTSPIHALLRAGYDLRKDILPPIRAAKAAGSHATNWAYYAKIVESKKHKNDKLKPAPVVASVATEWITDDDPRWPGLAAKHLAETGKPLVAMGSRHHPGMGHSFRSDWLEGQEKAA